MLKLTIAASLIAIFASAAFAEDFDNTSLVTTFNSGNLEFSATLDQADGLTEFGTTAYTTEGQLWGFETYTAVSLTYGRIAETLTLGVEGGATRDLNDRFAVYGDVAVDYVALVDELDEGNALITPTVGLSYGFTQTVAAFTEVGNTWDMSNDFTNLGGVAEVGLAVDLNDNLTVKGSVVQTFDTSANSAQAKIETVFSF